MTDFHFGLVHAPHTPFQNGAVDMETFARSLNFHIAHGADGLALPMHNGESVSLTVGERERLLEFALKTVAGRVPVVANVSEAGTSIAADLARHARRAGATALIASVPYYWTPPESMLIEHFAEIGRAGELPFFLYNSPHEMNGTKITTNIVLSLLKALPNFAGLVDCTLDWQFMIDVVSQARRAKPSFQFVSGTEYMISASATGAQGLLSNLAGLAPTTIRTLYDLCRQEKYEDAYAHQVDAALLWRLFKSSGVAGLKAAQCSLDRNVGLARPPLPALAQAETKSLLQELSAIPSMAREPRGWV